MATSATGGTIYAVDTTAADITGFDPAHDKLDLGGVSVHNFIVVDTSTGVGFMNPWTGDTIIITGVSLGQLTVDSFLPIENAHLRESLSGALAWEQGVTPAAHTVYARSHEIGRIDRVAFDPATDVVDFRYYGSREQITMTDGADGVIISNTGTGQSLILLGVTKAELSTDNFLFYYSQVREDRVHLQLGLGTIPDDRIVPQDMPVAGTDDWPTGVGTGDPPTGVAGEVFTISWLYGVDTVLDFDPAGDTLDFGWFKASEFELAESGGSTVITIVGNKQTYTLTGVAMAELTMSNITALSPDARAEWQAALDAAAATTPVLSIADATLVEGDTGRSILTFVVSLSFAADHDVSVSYTTLNGLANGGSDYVAQVGTLTIGAGQTRAVIRVPVLNDTLVEPTETFTVMLSSAEGARPGTATATGTITDNDVDPTPGELPSLSIEDMTMTEGEDGMGHMHLMVMLSKPSTETITVRYSTVDGTAKAGSDYTAGSGTLTFAPGQTSAMIMIPVTDDSAIEATERFRVRLTAPTNATIADGVAVATILNDDLPSLSISDAQATEADDGSVVMRFTLTLSEPAKTAVQVDFATQDVTALAGSDYVARQGTIGFAPGETVKTISVRLIGDDVAEAVETFRIKLGNVQGAVLADSVGAGRIADDDRSAATLLAASAAASSGTVDYVLANQWSTGFTADMTVGAGTLPLTGWTVEFDATFTITNIWNAVITSHVGTHYVIENASYNANIAAGAETSFGFQASGTATEVTGLELNGDAILDLPGITVADARLVEGDAGQAEMVFSLSLSDASEDAVTVQFRTADGTAVAGSDYVRQSGLVTFAAGETTQSVRIKIIGDTVQERNESVRLLLSNAEGATIEDATGRGIIVNNDDAGPGAPSVSISDGRIREGTAATGWLSTSGNQIVDADGNPVQISGVNWFGFEGTNMNPNGLWTRSYQDMMKQMVDEGFNTIRLPFSSDMLHSTATPGGIDYSKNPDLQGLTALQIMDKIVAYAEEIGLKIILDHHRSSAGNGTSENGLWYDSAHSQADWVADWQMLAQRYAANTAVIGADLHNEPYNGTWGGGGANDWALAAETAGNAIGAVNFNWLIFVEGVGSYKGDNYWWGGNLMGVRDRPIDLNLDNKLVYSPHDYPQTVYDQSWFSDPAYPDNLDEVFDEAWGYIYREGIAPVYVGEFGTKLATTKDAQWLDALTAYLGGDFDNDGTSDIAAGTKGISWTYWSWNPNSGDTGGILKDDWISVNENKMAHLTPIADDLIETGGSTGDETRYVSFNVTLSEAPTTDVTVDWRTVAGTATAADFEADSGRLTFKAGETAKVIRIAVTGDALAEGNEGFSVLLSNPYGVTVSDGRGLGTIVDDDALASSMDAVLGAVAAGDVGADSFEFALGGLAANSPALPDLGAILGLSLEGLLV
ncbi:Calx-beta domain-containing protein [Neotabrizicola shimadae]|uniref:cellulase n=1 Tax=Neotabrizicola shimadae TaxID=2807096 RepID=A0A8G1EAZ0_9RHOB|nr:Calx-beta domain-containing protein [Neotabrizicola shimadae]QYZ69100.1 cellulase family glycosylhydrolase [Neotabrizicola shimadae]